MPGELLNLLALAVGVGMLIVGGDMLVRGAVTLASRFGVSPLFIGLTVVAFGTSAPELALNVAAALKGNSGLSFGNIIGSNIANIGLILGLSALVRPMRVHHSVVRRELPIMLGATAVAAGLGVVGFSRDGVAVGDGFTRVEGVVLLALFAANMVYAVWVARASRGGELAMLAASEGPEEADRRRPLGVATALVLAGLALLVAGGRSTEWGASELARAMGLSDELIGLTVVAVATSLPELATSIMAARRGQVDIAVGNVVGSNVFNLLLVMGTTAVVSPVTLAADPRGAYVSLGVMLLLSVLLLPMARTNQRWVSQWEGGVLLAIYAGYIGYEVFMAVSHRGGAGV